MWWYQPLLWHASRRMRVEREFACDDLVLQTGTPACDYADELLAVASKAVLNPRPSPVSVSMAGRSTVEHRIRSILNPNTNRRALGRSGTALVILVGTMLLITATVLTPTFSVTADDSKTAKANSTERPTSSAEESSTEAVATSGSNDKKPSAKNVPAQSLESISGQVVDVSG
jgi:beta-lactamase regulating signal transducer with metallopeptidase domain